jgi:hypothetical protein
MIARIAVTIILTRKITVKIKIIRKITFEIVKITVESEFLRHR